MQRRRPGVQVRSASGVFSGFRFPPEVILLAVRWYLRFGLSYRDLEELLAERGIDVDHVTLYRWVQRFTPELVDAAWPCRHAVGGHWFVDETYVKVAGSWRYVYRAIDDHGQVIDVLVSRKRDTPAAKAFFAAAFKAHGTPDVVTTDKAPTLARALDELAPSAEHVTEQYENNRITPNQDWSSPPRSTNSQEHSDPRSQTNSRQRAWGSDNATDPNGQPLERSW